MNGALLRFSPTRFPAAVVRTRTIGEFVMSETRYESETSLPRHAHEYACLVFVRRGSFREQYEKRERAGEPGMVIMRPEGEPHSDRFARGGGRCLNVELPPQWIARVREHTRDLDRSAAFTGGMFPILGRRLLDELTNADDVSALAVESLLLNVFADAAREQRRSSSAPPPWLIRTKERIHGDLASRVTLAELATFAGVHRVHLATTFRRYFGLTVAGYVRRLRIEYACRALASSETPLAEIALAAGFSDQSHFGRTFKRAVRMTPAEYRAANVPTP